MRLMMVLLLVAILCMATVYPTTVAPTRPPAAPRKTTSRPSRPASLSKSLNSSLPRLTERPSTPCPQVLSPTATRKPTPALDDNKITVVLMSYPGSDRHHRLVTLLDKAAVEWRGFVEEVLLIWNGDAEKTAMPASVSEAIATINKKAVQNEGRKVVVLPQKDNRIDNRWRTAKKVRTAAALIMDDDINLSLEGALCLRSVWQSLAQPGPLVGIDVRSHFVHGAPSAVPKGGDNPHPHLAAEAFHKDAAKDTDAPAGPFGPLGYVARDQSFGFKKYSIVLPRSVMVHRAHLEAYDAMWQDEATGIRKIVDTLKCDDIALNYVVANMSRTLAAAKYGTSAGTTPVASSVLVKAKYEAYPESHSEKGLTKLKGMKEMRQRCVNELSVATGGTPSLRHWHVLCYVDG